MKHTLDTRVDTHLGIEKLVRKATERGGVYMPIKLSNE